MLLATRLYLRAPVVYDFDAFTHLGWARIYLVQGLWSHGFPWLPYSVVGQCGADNWYVFHVLLVPFTLAPHPLLQIAAAGTCLTFACLLLLWWALRLLRVRAAWLWPFLMVLAGPGTAGRYTMVRPHVISNALELLIIPFLCWGQLWQIALIGFVAAGVHLNVSWLLPLIASVWLVVNRLTTRRWEWRRLLAVIGGVVAGGVLQPNPLGSARLMWVQTYSVLRAHAQGVFMTTPLDLKPLDLATLRAGFLPVLAVWLVTIGLWLTVGIRRNGPDGDPADLRSASPFGPSLGGGGRWRTPLWTCLALSVLFLVLSVVAGRRATDQWLIFGLAGAALIVTVLAERPGAREWLRRRGLVRLAIGLAAALLVAGNGYQAESRSEAAGAAVMPFPLRLQAACDYLRGHAPPGVMVFSPHWEYFPELFFWDPNHTYYAGFDPVFTYAFSPDLYWKSLHMRAGDCARTCGQPQCAPGPGEDTYTVLRRDFHAGFLLLSKRDDPNFCNYAAGDRRFSLRYTDREFMVFALNGGG